MADEGKKTPDKKGKTRGKKVEPKAGLSRQATEGLPSQTTDGLSRQTADGLSSQTAVGLSSQTADGLSSQTAVGLPRRTTDELSRRATEELSSQTAAGFSSQPPARLSQEESKYDLTKERRTLRFQLPTSDFSSEESFISALSYTPGSVEEEEEDRRSSGGSAHVSILRKYIFAPIRHSQPRSAAKTHCCRRSDENPAFLVSESSKQLFEIVKHSPTPSDANLNLISATYLRKLEAVKEAIKDGADVNTSRNRKTPLLIAAEIGDDRMVAYLLTVPNINPDFQNKFGQTALILAVRNAFERIVSLLLDNKADVNLADHMGKTPLLAALFQKSLSLTKLLLAYGADCNQPDLFGENPLYAAAVKMPDLECLLTLLKVGASPESLSLSGTPLLSRSILYLTDFRIIEALVQYGASVNFADLITKKTPLHFAALTNDLKVAKFLVAQGADVNLKTSYGFTPLQEAQIQKSTLVAEYLVGRTKPKERSQSLWPKKGRTDVLTD